MKNVPFWSADLCSRVWQIRQNKKNKKNKIWKKNEIKKKITSYITKFRLDLKQL